MSGPSIYRREPLGRRCTTCIGAGTKGGHTCPNCGGTGTMPEAEALGPDRAANALSLIKLR
jgi:DnaJ-class molecular chaperone